MTHARTTLEIFCEQLRALNAAPPADLEGLAEELEAALRGAALAWPELQIPREALLTQLARCVANSTDLRATLRTLRVDALGLVVASCTGSSAAVQTFDRTYLQPVLRGLARHPAAAWRDELHPRLLSHLFVAEAGQLPRLTHYGGRGDLMGWLRVVVLREAGHLMRRTGREQPLDEAVTNTLGVGAAQELGALKALYGPLFKAAFERALAELTERQRTLLRYQTLDRLSIDELATIYRVHRATAARWIADARDRLLRDTRRHMSERLGVRAPEFDSIARLVQSELANSLERMLC